MDTWWWIPIGLVSWFAVAIAVALLLGPVLKSCTQTREAQIHPAGKILALPGKLPPYWRQVS